MKQYSVTAVNSYIKALLLSNENLNNICVEGEISNYKATSSGHCYFSLKDENSLLKCVMFRIQAAKLDFEPENGMKVQAFGSISVYERDGVYQLYVDQMKPAGLGNLYEEFEKLKKKLSEEGLFDSSHKKAIPFLPHNVGVVTSETGAAIQDIKNVLFRRFPNMRMTLYPVAVQGSDASRTIVNAIKKANQDMCCDVLIVGRGGGSIEDLWAFNEEPTARAIFNSDIPVISAVGHEIDFTISDFVADLRAPTPSAAAELVVPIFDELVGQIDYLRNRLLLSKTHTLDVCKSKLEIIKQNSYLNKPMTIVDDKHQEIDGFRERLSNNACNYILQKKHIIELFGTKLVAINPENVLDRGFGIVKNKDGKIITKSSMLKTGEEFVVTLKNDAFEGRKL